jgi:hypothetical protein
MGNAESHAALTAPTAALPSPEDVLADLPATLSVRASLGGGRFLKTVRSADARAAVTVLVLQLE